MISNYCATLTGYSFGPLNFGGILGEASWTGIVFLGLLASALGLALVYALSQLMRLPRLEAWTKFELFQLLATAVLALILAGWVYGMCHWDASILSPDYQANRLGILKACNGDAGTIVNERGQPIVTPFCAAQNFLQKVKTRGDDIFQLLITLNYGVSYLFKTVWESRPLGIGYTLEPLAGFQQLQNIFLVAVSGFMVSYLSVLIQMRILDYLLIAVPFYFMPIGLLLRAFAPSREFGGALVGFGIASLLFYPLILVMNDVVVYSSFNSVTQPAADANGAMSALAADTLLGNFNTASLQLSDIKEGQPFSAGGASVQVKQLLLSGPDQVEFLGSDGQTYVINLTAPGSQTASVYLKGKTVDPKAGGYEFDKYLGLFNNQPDAGTNNYAPRTDANGNPIDTGAAVDYFTKLAPGERTPGWAQKLTDMIFGVFNIIMVYMVAAVLLPIVNLIIYIEIGRSMTKFLGAEMDLSNLSRLI